MKDNPDAKMASLFFGIALACTLLAMVCSPLERDNWSVAAASVAIVTAIGGIYLAFQSWNAPLPEDLPPEAAKVPAQSEDEKTAAK